MEVSVYLHFPFCIQRCHYCDFNTYAGIEQLIPAYVDALCQEIEFIGRTVPEAYRHSVHTVYFGGGTPSLLSDLQLRKILTALDSSLGLEATVEISLEANPGTLSLAKLQTYAELGINRLSLGFQSANEEELRLLGRTHLLTDVLTSVELARTAGIRNLNLDLIYGLPNQTLQSWERSLRVALSLGVEHLSLYSLTIEEGTVLDRWIQAGFLSYPDTDLAAACYELAREMLAKAGYLHYEISNWALLRRGGEAMVCRHNLQYWKNREYFGLGAGAHGFLSGYRLVNVIHPQQYIERMQADAIARDFPFTPATQEYHCVSTNEEMKDTVLLGLRLVEEGIGELDFLHRFGKRLSEAFPQEIDRLIRKGLVEWIETDQRRLRLSRLGQLLGNQAFIEFV